jgi:hypothetical protein
MQGVLKNWRWRFVAIALSIAAAIGVAVLAWAESSHDSIARRAGLLRPGMTRAEMIEIMGCVPRNPTPTYSGPDMQAANGTMLFWSDGEHYFIMTALDLDGKFIGDPIVKDTNPPPWRRALDWFKAHLGW